MSRDRKLAAWLTFVGIFAALNYVATFTGGSTSSDVLYHWSTAVAGVLQYAVVLGILLLIARGLPKREAFALRRPRSWGAAVGLGVLVFIGVYVVAGVLEPFLNPGKEQGLVPSRWEPAHAAAFGVNLFVVSVVGPAVEELTFRGLGFTLLLRFGTWVAVPAVGLLFALAHGLVEALPLLTVFGAGLAYMRARTTSVFPGIVLHGLFNASVLTIAVTT